MMETSPVITPDQLMTPAVFADPYPVYRQLRAQLDRQFAEAQLLPRNSLQLKPEPASV